MNVKTRFSLMALCALALSVLLSACETTPTDNAGGVYHETELAARARSHTDLGAAYYQQNKLEIALDEFSRAVEIDANFGQAYNGLGLVFAALGEDIKADANFKKAIQVQPASSVSR